MFESFFESSLVFASIAVFLNPFSVRLACDPITVVNVRPLISHILLHNAFPLDDRLANRTFIDGSVSQYQQSVLVISLSSLEISFIIATI